MSSNPPSISDKIIEPASVQNNNNNSINNSNHPKQDPSQNQNQSQKGQQNSSKSQAQAQTNPNQNQNQQPTSINEKMAPYFNQLRNKLYEVSNDMQKEFDGKVELIQKEYERKLQDLSIKYQRRINALEYQLKQAEDARDFFQKQMTEINSRDLSSTLVGVGVGGLLAGQEKESGSLPVVADQQNSNLSVGTNNNSLGGTVPAQLLQNLAVQVQQQRSSIPQQQANVNVNPSTIPLEKQNQINNQIENLNLISDSSENRPSALAVHNNEKVQQQSTAAQLASNLKAGKFEVITVSQPGNLQSVQSVQNANIQNLQNIQQLQPNVVLESQPSVKVIQQSIQQINGQKISVGQSQQSGNQNNNNSQQSNS